MQVDRTDSSAAAAADNDDVVVVSDDDGTGSTDSQLAQDETIRQLRLQLCTLKVGLH